MVTDWIRDVPYVLTGVTVSYFALIVDCQALSSNQTSTLATTLVWSNHALATAFGHFV